MKKSIAVIVAVTMVSIIMIITVFRDDAMPPDAVLINSAVQEAMHGDSVYESVNILTYRLTMAFEDLDASRQSRAVFMQFFLLVIVCVFTLSGLLFCLYWQRNLIKPFRKLRSFAQRIAAGSLDMPLEMDKSNMFGAFPESFDLMREELKAAKEREHIANLQKKELVASLSHDIKTPVASIMSAMDIMLVNAENKKERKTIEAVNTKLEQINALVTNMFHATLEELQALKVSLSGVQSTDIKRLIENADYEGRVLSFTTPDCIVLADPMRLQQVFDNIMHNSYKYADTDISIKSAISGDNLIIDVRDYGTGVLDEEIPLLTSKFYRGKNAENSDGYGLGLYISKYFMEQMSGDLSCVSNNEGFTVKLTLNLA
jgi:signal transduction histidine kinase